MVSSGYGCHPDEKDFTCKLMHPHGHTENNYVTWLWMSSIWGLLAVSSGYGCHPCKFMMRRTSGYGCLVSLSIHMATQRTTMSPVNMETTGG